MAGAGREAGVGGGGGREGKWDGGEDVLKVARVSSEEISPPRLFLRT